MHKDFNYWKAIFDSEDLIEFSNSQEGLLWFKIKSITRKGIIDEFIKKNKIDVNEKGIGNQFYELYKILVYDVSKAHELLNSFIKTIGDKETRDCDLEHIVKELYKVDNYKWGADNQNDLGKFLVKKYVKDNNSYDYLINQMEGEVLKTVQDYLVCSFYNHWSSIMIENLFKSHPNVLSNVGKTKSVDFFINEIPFDLKVTKLPEFFIEKKREQLGLPKEELQSLKQTAKELKIKFSNDDVNLYYSLSKRLKDNGSEKAIATLNEIKNVKLKIIKDIKANPRELAKELYENQSNFRFGAENRLFLILIDTNDFSASWELKRNIDFLKPKIFQYLDNFKAKKINDLKIHFHKEGKPKSFPKVYETLSDVLLIEK